MERRRQDRPTSWPAPRGVTLMSISFSDYPSQDTRRPWVCSHSSTQSNSVFLNPSSMCGTAHDLKVFHSVQRLSNAKDQIHSIHLSHRKRVLGQAGVLTLNTSYFAGQPAPTLLLLFVLQVILPLFPCWRLTHLQQVIHLVHNSFNGVATSLKFNPAPP